MLHLTTSRGATAAPTARSKCSPGAGCGKRRQTGRTCVRGAAREDASQRARPEVLAGAQLDLLGLRGRCQHQALLLPEAAAEAEGARRACRQGLSQPN